MLVYDRQGLNAWLFEGGVCLGKLFRVDMGMSFLCMCMVYFHFFEFLVKFWSGFSMEINQNFPKLKIPQIPHLI